MEVPNFQIMLHIYLAYKNWVTLLRLKSEIVIFLNKAYYLYKKMLDNLTPDKPTFHILIGYKG